MKPALIFTLFVAAIWLIVVSAYALYECGMEAKGLGPVSTFAFRDELLQALNLAFPIAVVALFGLLKANQSDPVAPELFRLCLITCVLGIFLGLKAKRAAYPDPADPVIAEAIWWLPDR